MLVYQRVYNGKIHYFDWAIFNSYVTNYQRVDQWSTRRKKQKGEHYGNQALRCLEYKPHRAMGNHNNSKSGLEQDETPYPLVI